MKKNNRRSGAAKKILAVIMSIAILTGLIFQFFSSTVSAEGLDAEPLEIIYFYNEKCLSCKENTGFINNLSKKEGVLFKKYNTEEDGCTNVQMAYAKNAGVSTEESVKVPAIYFANEYYNLSPAVYTTVEERVDMYTTGKLSFSNFKYNKETCETPGFEQIYQDLSVWGIIFAGLLDGINPCAISMLLVFYSFLVFCNKKRILLLSASFIVGMFVVNFLFGIGVSFFYDTLSGNDIIISVLFCIAIAACAVAVTINSIDIYKHYKKDENTINQLSDTTKFKITAMLKKAASSKFAIPVAAVTGLMVGGIELACTGQIYLPTLTYMFSINGFDSTQFFMLIIYNIAYILPLIAVTVAAALVADSEILKKKLMGKNHIVKIIANVFYVIMMAVILSQILKLFA